MNIEAQPTRTLAAALRTVAHALQAQNPPPDLQARVRAAARPGLQARVTAAAGRGRGWAWSGMAVATVLVGSAVLMLRLPPPAPLAVDDGLRFGGFVPVAPPERWPRDAAPAWLVRTELQGERLAAMGLPYDPARAGDSVRAELLLHPSGEVLAVRFLQ